MKNKIEKTDYKNVKELKINVNGKQKKVSKLIKFLKKFITF